MRLSQKTVYAVRALYELSKHHNLPPLSIATIAERQGIPAQFLQVIMRELRQGGFVVSRRGKAGGYTLAQPPRATSIGAILRFFEGDFTLIDGNERDNPGLANLWRRAGQALDDVFDTTTLANLIEDERRALGAADFVI
ncbi:MAG: RrF2 family transcriptional regulator [Planctomycetota bacterium]|jgi:Rrf2 family protein